MTGLAYFVAGGPAATLLGLMGGMMAGEGLSARLARRKVNLMAAAARGAVAAAVVFAVRQLVGT
jgi:hypothetical protein